ncbi:hypothetical protein FB451DRAFT_1182853 [Mycena latifolia]|nr:hypothetical protein FB451DRAFT_1182853 [Mycena latifolia]
MHPHELETCGCIQQGPMDASTYGGYIHRGTKQKAMDPSMGMDGSTSSGCIQCLNKIKKPMDASTWAWMQPAYIMGPMVASTPDGCNHGPHGGIWIHPGLQKKMKHGCIHPTTSWTERRQGKGTGCNCKATGLPGYRMPGYQMHAGNATECYQMHACNATECMQARLPNVCMQAGLPNARRQCYRMPGYQMHAGNAMECKHAGRATEYQMHAGKATECTHAGRATKCTHAGWATKCTLDQRTSPSQHLQASRQYMMYSIHAQKRQGGSQGQGPVGATIWVLWGPWNPKNELGSVGCWMHPYAG